MTLFHGLGHVASGRLRSQPGMVLLTPTSIAHSGTSASIGANGQVTFTAVTSLSLNGVFSATYDNYVISMRHVANTGNNTMSIRFRASGTDASGSDYARQRIEVSSTTVSALRETSQTSGRFGDASAAQRSGYAVHVYGPFLAQPTALRSVSADGQGDASILENAVTHSLSTSYDGFSIIIGTNNFTGALQVYGVRS